MSLHVRPGLCLKRDGLSQLTASNGPFFSRLNGDIAQGSLWSISAGLRMAGLGLINETRLRSKSQSLMEGLGMEMAWI